MIELKPCPFCGTGFYKDVQRAAEDWNRRANDE